MHIKMTPNQKKKLNLQTQKKKKKGGSPRDIILTPHKEKCFIFSEVLLKTH